VEQEQKGQGDLGRRLTTAGLPLLMLLGACAKSTAEPTGTEAGQEAILETPLRQAWVTTLDDGSRLLVEHLDHPQERLPMVEPISSDAQMAASLGLLPEGEQLLQVRLVPASTEGGGLAGFQLESPVGAFIGFEEDALERMLAAAATEEERAQVRLYWHGVVQGGAAEEGMRTLLARQGRLLHGPAVDLPAESTLTASFGGNSIVLQARRWTPQDRRRFLEGSQTSSDE